MATKKECGNNMTRFIDQFLPFERNIFLTLNKANTPFWDDIMWTYTGIVTWVPMFFFIVYITFKNKNLKEGFLIVSFILLVILFSQIISASIFKPLFQRFRPSHHPDYKDIVRILHGFRGGDYGFISGHATTSFGLAIFLSLLFRNRILSFSLILWASLNSYSRIYLGVHFISDIIAGLIIGSLIGLLVYHMYKYSREQLFNTSANHKGIRVYNIKEGNILAVFILSYIAFVILLSPFLSSFSHSIIPNFWF